ncbi:MAG: acetylglutamate kinase [Defluviitaleaceae bacterium]|nr:acetylglutamate kinase [Defluviitaleaceae bacterium]
MSFSDRARILYEALPYIKKFYGKTMVIKYGGSAMQNEAIRRSVIGDIVLLSLVGINVVLVHGGGPEINEMLLKIGKEPKFINGLRYTDSETIEIVQMVLCGKIGKELSKLISEFGGKSLGLSGLDSSLIICKKINDNLGFVGEITKINPEPIKFAINGGYIPIISTIASGEEKETNISYNVNADHAAAAIGATLKAEKLILLTDVEGLRSDPKDEKTIVSQINVLKIKEMMKDGSVVGGMIPKLECCVEAVENGVNGAHILDGRHGHSLLIELFTDTGIGTMILKD